MPIGLDPILADVSINGFNEDQCFESTAQFIKWLVSALAVEIPDGVSNVIVGQNVPGSSETQCLWIRTDGSHSFIGLYLYASGAWNQIYPVPGEIFLIQGRSNAVPAGYLFTANDPAITPAQLAALKKLWVEDPMAPGVYTQFHVTRTQF